MDSGEDNTLGTALKKSDKSNITDTSPQKRRSESSEVPSDSERSRRSEETSGQAVGDPEQEEPDDVPSPTGQPASESLASGAEGSTPGSLASASPSTRLPALGRHTQARSSAKRSTRVPVTSTPPSTNRPTKSPVAPSPPLKRRSTVGSITPASPSTGQSNPGSRASAPPSTKGSTPGRAPPQPTRQPASESRSSVPSSTRSSTSGAVSSPSPQKRPRRSVYVEEPATAWNQPSTSGIDYKQTERRPTDSKSPSSSGATFKAPFPRGSNILPRRPSKDSEARKPSDYYYEPVLVGSKRRYEENKKSLRKHMEDFLNEFDTNELLKDEGFVALLVGVINERKNREILVPHDSDEHKNAWISNRAEDMEKIKKDSFMRELRRKGRSYFVGSPEEDLGLTNKDYHSFHEINIGYVRQFMEAFLKNPGHRGPHNRIFMFHLTNMLESHLFGVPIWRRMEVSDDEDEEEDESTRPSTSAPPSAKRERRPSRRSAPGGLARKRTVFTAHQKSVLEEAIESGKAGETYRQKLSEDLELPRRNVTLFIGNRKRSTPSEIRRRNGTLQAAVKSKKKKDEGESDDSGPSTSTSRPSRRFAPGPLARERTVFTDYQKSRLEAAIKNGKNPSADDRKKLCEDLKLPSKVVKNFITNQRRKKKEEDESD